MDEERERGRERRSNDYDDRSRLRVSRLGHGTPAAIPVSRFAAGLWEMHTCRLSPERADDGEAPFLFHVSLFAVRSSLFTLVLSALASFARIFTSKIFVELLTTCIFMCYTSFLFFQWKFLNESCICM